MGPKAKWKFAIGTTSRVPRSSLHYLIIDIDGDTWNENLVDVLTRAHHVVIQKTRHGWHFYTDWTIPFHTLVFLLKFVRADPAWIRIGEQRGYFFLADKSKIELPWPVEHMVLHHGKKKT